MTAVEAQKKIFVVDPLGHVAGEVVEAERVGREQRRRGGGREFVLVSVRSTLPSSPSASLPAKFAVPETTGRSLPQGYLSGLPVLAARATNSHSASVGRR